MRENETEANQTRGPRGDSKRKKVRSREREIAREIEKINIGER